MKKNLLKFSLIAVIGLVCGMNVYNSQRNNLMSDVALANVEALADGESSGGHIVCYSGSGTTFLCKCSNCTWGYTGGTASGTCY